MILRVFSNRNDSMIMYCIFVFKSHLPKRIFPLRIILAFLTLLKLFNSIVRLFKIVSIS